MGPDTKEVVGGWGWTEERQSWSWGKDSNGLWPLNISVGKLNVNVYAKAGAIHTPDAACTEVGLSIKTTSGKVVDLGKKPVGHATQFTATYTDVDYAAGTITATCTAGTSDAAVGASTSYTTAGTVAKLLLVADRTTIMHSRDDLAYVDVIALDAHGTIVPDAAVSVSFKLDGVGEIAALGNGDPQDIDSVQGTERLTWRGKSIAILRPKGTKSGSITLTASAQGLPDATVVVMTKSA
jgi:beta-galactosidase